MISCEKTVWNTEFLWKIYYVSPLRNSALSLKSWVSSFEPVSHFIFFDKSWFNHHTHLINIGMPHFCNEAYTRWWVWIIWRKSHLCLKWTWRVHTSNNGYYEHMIFTSIYQYTIIWYISSEIDKIQQITQMITNMLCEVRISFMWSFCIYTSVGFFFLEFQWHIWEEQTVVFVG